MRTLVGMAPEPEPTQPPWWRVSVSGSAITNASTVNASQVHWSIAGCESMETRIARRALYDDRTIPGEVEE